MLYWQISAYILQTMSCEILFLGGKAIAVECDVTDENQIIKMVDRTIDSFGSILGMVANAGTSGSGWIHQTDRADWQFVLDVNLTGPFLCAKHTLPLMMEAGGSFVVTSSIAGSVVGAGAQQLPTLFPSTVS